MFIGKQKLRKIKLPIYIIFRKTYIRFVNALNMMRFSDQKSCNSHPEKNKTKKNIW